VAGVCGAGAGLLAGSAVGPATSRRLPQCSSHHRSASTNDDRNGADGKKPVIVTTTSLKRLKQLRAERAPDDEDGPEAAAAMRAWLERAKWGRGPAG
jgi:hypothetical protein